MLPLTDEQMQALIKLGESQLELNQLRQADKSFQTLLKYMPAHPEALYGLAEIARRQHNTRKQQARLEELVSVHPQHLAGVLALARLLDGKPELAVPYLERALEVQPDEPQLLLQAAASLQRAGQAERSRFYLTQLLARQPLGPHAAEAWLLLAQAALRCGELQQAAEAFDKAAASDPAIRADHRFVDLEARWNQIEARANQLDWQAIEKKLEKQLEQKGYDLDE